MRRAAVHVAGALIVGGGPAGAAAAITLAQAGAPHLLLERTREPGDALCGGFLSWRSLDTLARLGVDADALNPAPVRRLRVVAGQRVGEAALPRPGRAVSRRRLDAMLLARAEATGARIERGAAVRSLDAPSASVDGAPLIAEAIFLASGKHEVRGAARPVVRAVDPTLGLRVRLPAGPGLARLVGDAVELHLFDGGYAGLVLQEDGSANLCMAVRRSRLTAVGDPARLLRALGDAHPLLGERLAHAATLPDADAVANVPYGWRARTTRPGLFRLGDQAAVIPSLAGEGMGIALASGLSAARALVRGGSEAAPAYQRAFHRATARPVRVADLVRALAERPATAPLLAAFAPLAAGGVARLTRVAPVAGG